MLQGARITEPRLKSRGAAANWLLAHCGRREVVSQAWALTGGASPCARTAAGLALIAAWEVPEVHAADTVVVSVRCRVRAGPVATHLLRITTSNGGGTLNVNLAAGLSTSWQVFTATLAAVYVGGWESVTMQAEGDAATPIEVASILVRHPSLASLAAGRAADGRVAMDTDEDDADRPLSARHMSALRDDILSIRDQARVAANLSDLRNVDSAGQDMLPAYAQAWGVVRLPDTDERELVVTARVYVTTSVDSWLIIAHSSDGMSSPRSHTAVPAGLVRQLVSVDLVLAEPGARRRRGLASMAHDIEWVGVGIWQQPDPATDRIERGAMSTVDAVHSVSLVIRA